MEGKHINLQEPKTNKIYGVIKQGANKSDQNIIKTLQKRGYDEHEIQNKSGVHFSVVRTFMLHNDSDFKESDSPVTPDTQHLHDRINELESLVKESDEHRVNGGETMDGEDEDEDEDEDDED